MGTVKGYSQDIKTKSKSSLEIDEKKSAPPAIEKKLAITDSLTIPIDSLKKTVAPKTLLQGKIKYIAKDYVRIEQKKKLITLHNNAELFYTDTELKAGVIILNYDKSEVLAGRIKDSVGKLSQYPNFKQAENLIEPDSLRFNFKSKKALIWNSKTSQGEFHVKSVLSKKENDSVYFLKGARFTTSAEVDNPEYYFQTSKVKIIPGKKVIAGLTHMVIADVPTPIAVPFAFFPLSKETSVSGILLPSYNDSNTRGFSLQNLGYYFALSDNYDLTVLGDYYTNGSYAMRFESTYAKKYRYRGNFNFRFENIINSERGLPDYSKSNLYNLQWSHSRDAKGSPNSSFSASVNMGSSRYFRQSINQSNVGSNLNNTLNSNISYSKTFESSINPRLTIGISHNQNTETSVVNMTLPDMQFGIDQIYPFVGKKGQRKGLLKNINFRYTLDGKNSFATTDSLFLKKEMFNSALNGLKHTIPLSTNFKLLKYLSATATANYNEVWYIKTIERVYDVSQAKVVDKNLNGFESFRTYNFSGSLGTTIYGTFNFKPTRKIKSIRHVVRPSVSYINTPSFDQYFDKYATDATNLDFRDYTRFEGGVFGAPSNSKSSSLGFSISNTLEAKVTDPDSTKVEPKKIMLLNNLNFSTSYDLNADGKTRLGWSPVVISGGTQLFKEKMNVNFGATIDPYAITNTGNRINKLNINNGGSLFRMTSANLTLGYSISNKNSEKGENQNINSQGVRNGGREDDLFGKNIMDQSRPQDKETEVTDKDVVSDFFASIIPWDMTFAYSLTYSNNNRENEITGNSLMIAANTDLTPKWKVGVTTGYDFVQNGVTYTQLRFERDLLSWRMDFSWQPFGQQANWSFFIGIKAGILSDIKYDKFSQNTR